MAEKSKDFKISDESIDILASKSHELEFVDLQYKVNAYRCCQCKNVAIKHRIANCQHVFCHECYAIYYETQCPACETVITESILDDDFTKTVLNFKVSCEFKKNGCQTIVQLGEFLGHTKYCRLATKRLLPKLYKADPQAEASEQINANLQEMKIMMQGQQTEITQLKDAVEEMTKQSKKQEDKIVKINETIISIERKFQDNLNACAGNDKRLTILTNKLSSRLYQSEMQNTNRTQIQPTEFMHYYRKYVLGETLLRDLNSEVNSSDSLDTSIDWTITGVRQKLENWKKYGDVFAESEEFSIPSPGLKFRAKLQKWSNSRMHIRLHFTSKPSADSPLFLHSRKFVLVDRSKDHEGKHDFVWMNEPILGENCTKEIVGIWPWYLSYFPVSLLEDRDKYVKDDEFLFRIILEPIAKMFKRISSMDGTLLVRIDDYTERKREEVNGIRPFLTSESFYTSDKGFRMDVEIYLNGFLKNEGKGISIYPMCRIGEWDDTHSFPIKIKYKRFLMDQSDAPTKRNISYESGIQKCENPYYMYKNADFMSHKDVENFPYLKDDSLLIKIVIEIVDT